MAAGCPICDSWVRIRTLLPGKSSNITKLVVHLVVDQVNHPVLPSRIEVQPGCSMALQIEPLALLEGVKSKGAKAELDIVNHLRPTLAKRNI
jgi:hypothetical protein